MITLLMMTGSFLVGAIVALVSVAASNKLLKPD